MLCTCLPTGLHCLRIGIPIRRGPVPDVYVYILAVEIIEQTDPVGLRSHDKDREQGLELTSLNMVNLIL